MDQEIIDKHIKAGKIAAEALQYGKSLMKPGTKINSVLDAIEKKITDEGGGIAFPAQISLNETAAHACATLDEETTLTNEHIAKLDVGVHMDGYIADNALTVDLTGKYGALVNASREALNNALKIIKPGTKLKDIGKIIHETITSHGFSPVRNLSGHGLGQFKIHTRPSVPNFDNGSNFELEEGMVIAIEPFASTGAGIVQESHPATIFTLVKDHGIRDPITRNILKEIKTYRGLPFAKRWLERKFGIPKTNFALRNLMKAGCLQDHPPLVDQGRGMVSQAEHSVIVLEKPIVFTRLD